MSELDDLEKAYLAKNGITFEEDGTSLPHDYRELQTTLHGNPDARSADRQVRVANVRRLLEQLDSSDNQVVKMQKRRVIRAELNALRLLEALEA